LKYTEAGSTIHNELAEKGREKKPSSINPRQPAGQGRKKKKPGINPGQPAGKWRKNKNLVLTWAACRKREKKKEKTLILTLGSPPE
jgi:hypothetical protein